MTPKNIALLRLGEVRIREFCEVNGVPALKVIDVPREEWRVKACAYYRNSTIHICAAKCARIASGERQIRNWNWPGSVIDRTPYGVVCHELGHHFDVINSHSPGKYMGQFSRLIRMESAEPPLTKYAPDDGEWFAEMFRLFVTNTDLLRCVRPLTYKSLSFHFWTVETRSWLEVLGSACPNRIRRSLISKMVGVK